MKLGCNAAVEVRLIRASSGKTVEALAADLSSSSDVARDAAVARLAVIGARAVQRVAAVAADRSTGPASRVAAFRVLEAIGDSRGLKPALAATADSDISVATAALNVVALFLDDPADMAALDCVTAIALDRARARSIRVAAVRALLRLDRSTIKPIIDTLASDPDAEIARASHAAGRRMRAADRLADAAVGQLGDDPAALRAALASGAVQQTLPALHQIVDRTRIREGAVPPAERAAWTAVRAAAHAALARRGSRLALYDLRETVAAAKQPLPLDFVTALTLIGEATCLEAVAAAYVHASKRRPADDWWARQLGDAFRAIVTREQLTRRHTAVKKIERSWPGLFGALASAR
jgi:hypothetical protein